MLRAALVGGLALAATGCAAERTLIFTSDPPGAQVRLDDEMVGTTPVEVPFLHYGTRRVTYYLEEHRTRSFLVEVKAPWYGRFPIDLISEILIPVGWKDRKRVHTVLEPSDRPTDVPTQRSVFDRAEVLRRAGPNGPREMPPIEVVPALPQPTEPAADDAPSSSGGASGQR
ncbi:PEGA domain protein [Planctomycetes bacterium Pla163]|uniref:PEGA domain protein n=1 Tax=Rohdeia mirabilis TaxID=2528008 RepID=A0A518CWS6_9BACT|nr:PEGA domain protein [Planctomycetes bacterium Pla163]